MTVLELIDEAYSNSVAHGFHAFYRDENPTWGIWLAPSVLVEGLSSY